MRIEYPPVGPHHWLRFAALLAVSPVACDSAANLSRPAATHSDSPAPDPERGPSPGTGSANVDTGPIRVEPLDDTDPPVFVVRGSGLGTGKLVFLHGMCGHGLGYAQSFQHAAATKGTLIAPQADVVCGDGPGAKWTRDVAAIDARITAAFRKLGHEEPLNDICVLGMSQGATRAAALARMFPERYTRLASMGAPTRVEAAGLERLRAAVLMVGERERKDLMRASERALSAKGVPATSLVIPDADHAGMGSSPEETMDAALDWLWEHSKAVPEASE